MTGDAQLQVPAALTHVQRSHSLGTCASLDSTMTQCNTAHVSLNHCMEAENSAPDPEGESCCERMGTLEPTSAPSREDGGLFAWLT